MSFASPISTKAVAGRAGTVCLLLSMMLIASGFGGLGPSPAYARAPSAQLNCLYGQVSSRSGQQGTGSLVVTGKGIGEPACIYIDHPALNNNPGARSYETPNWNPGGIGGTYNNHVTGVWYDAAVGLWAIANQDFKPIPAGASFNVAFTNSDPLAAAHVTTAANTSGHMTYLDHPLANGNPYALIQASSSWNSGAGGMINAHVTGVWYDTGRGKWAVFNQDGAAMPLNTSFHIYITQPSSFTFVQRATTSNTYGNSTWIDHPATNGKPNAVLIVTPNWNPAGAGGTYNNHVTGVWYDTGRGKWAVFNQDGAAMPTGTAFNVLVVE